MLYRITIKTGAQVDLKDITSEVKKVVSSSGVQSGVCYLFVPHTTSGVTVNEQADPSVVEDVITQLDNVIPQHQHYRHLEGNSPAHIKAILVGSSETLIIENGGLILGTWQGIFFCEFDGPRNRNLLIKIIPDNS